MMTGAALVKLFAWVIGALVLLWILVQCLGGPGDPTEPEGENTERNAEQYAEDCRNTWEALELMGEADHENVDTVVDEIDLIASEIEDPELSEMAYAFVTRTQEMVEHAEPGDTEELEDTYHLYRGLVEVDLSLRCAGVDRSD
ncbi:hypothetical protein [Glycomyces tenuis]|uniref:hypothetical protein n=1 Tax=Glycomyces tenuis TaxID=58116 RepID=UPI00041B5122|nr:hypothetical protein [Glycomyces tenuis]